MRKCLNVFLFFIITLSVYAQDASPFHCEVVSDGSSLLNPFTGGFLSPQFSEVDFNGDGHNDLFVFDRAGDVPMLFLYEEGDYVYQAEIKAVFGDLQEWAYIIDYDKDEIGDLFTIPWKQGIDGIEVYKGSRVGEQMTFDLVEFPEFPQNVLSHPFGNGTVPLYAASGDLAAIQDIDFDGDLDVLSFESVGAYIRYYKNMAIENGDLSKFDFRLEDMCYGKVFESAFTAELFLSNDPDNCSDGFKSDKDDELKHSLHAGSTINAFDFSGNGLTDVLIGDLDGPSLTLGINNGSLDNAWITEQELLYPTDDLSVNIPLFVGSFMIDVDHDGTKDMIAAPNSAGNTASTENIWYYKNENHDGGVTLSFQQDDFLSEHSLDFGTYTSPIFIDVNQDGLKDVLVGTSGRRLSVTETFTSIIYLENTGTASSPKFELKDEDWLNFSDFRTTSKTPALTFGDLDGDNDLDLIVGDDVGQLYYYENTAGANNPLAFSNPIFQYMGIAVSKWAKPALVDIDNDGLLDLVVGENNNNTDPDGNRGALNYYKNIGSTSSALFDSDLTQSFNNPTLGMVNTQTVFSTKASSAPCFVRNGDDYLLFAGSDKGDIFVYDGIKLNDQGAFNLLSSDYGSIIEGRITTPAVADIDDDGYYEMLLGNFRGGLSFYNTDFEVQLVNTEEPLAEKIHIWPNPTSDQLWISNLGTSDFNVKIYNLNGQLILKKTNETNLDISALVSGLHIIEIETEEQLYTQKIVIKQF